MLHTTMIKEAMKIANYYHKDQLDKGGYPYIYHLISVADYMSGEYEVVLALLHDLWEDTICDETTLFDWYPFPDIIITALRAITRNKHESYLEYITRVKKNELATIVKIEDLEHNLDMSRLPFITEKDMEMESKYRKALHFLKQDNQGGE